MAPLATRLSLAGLAVLVLLTASGGTLAYFRILLLLHSALILAYLALSLSPEEAGTPRWKRMALDGFPLWILAPLFWSHRHVWFPWRANFMEEVYRFLDRILRGPRLIEAVTQIQETGDWGGTWTLWFFPVGGFFAVGFLVWSRSSRESFLSWRDGAVTAFWLSSALTMVFPFRGPGLAPGEGGANTVLLAFSSVSAWDGRAPVSVLVSVLWASWKSSRGPSLFLSKFFLALAAATTAGVAFSPVHYAFSAFVSPALGLVGAALANSLNRGDTEEG